MTAEELIKELKKLPRYTPVVVEGYEGGYNDITISDTITVRQKRDSHWYEGEFESVEDAERTPGKDLIDDGFYPVFRLAGKNNNAKESIN